MGPGTPARSGFKLKNSSATDARGKDREPTSSFLGMSVCLCVCVHVKCREDAEKEVSGVRGLIFGY